MRAISPMYEVRPSTRESSCSMERFRPEHGMTSMPACLSAMSVSTKAQLGSPAAFASTVEPGPIIVPSRSVNT